MEAVAQWIVIPVVVGSSPISHPSFLNALNQQLIDDIVISTLINV